MTLLKKGNIVDYIICPAVTYYTMVVWHNGNSIGHITEVALGPDFQKSEDFPKIFVRLS